MGPFFSLVCILLVATLDGAATTGECYASTVDLSLRQAPSSRATKEAIITEGGVVQRIDKDYEVFADGYIWWKIQYGQHKGYSVNEFLKKADCNSAGSHDPVKNVIFTCGSTSQTELRECQLPLGSNSDADGLKIDKVHLMGVTYNCFFGYSYGVTVDYKRIWTSRGCTAKFMVIYSLTELPGIIDPRLSGLADTTTGEVKDPTKLAKILPLKLMTTILDINHYSGILSNKAAITFVFSRSVIALGSNFGEYSADTIKVNGITPLIWNCNNEDLYTPPVQGKFRWATTTMLRFDIDKTWPSDIECFVRVNPKLQAWDGTPIDIDSLEEKMIKTASLYMNIQRIISEKTTEITNGAWSSSDEVPPDGVIQIRFSNIDEVDAAMTQKSLKLFEPNTEQTREVVVTQVSDTVVNVTVPKLENYVYYHLVLEKGAKVSKSANNTHEKRTIGIYGLKPFAFQFTQYTSVQHLNQRMAISHGVPDNFNFDKLLQHIKFSPTVQNLEITKVSPTVFNLHGDFKPDHKYSIAVTGSDELKDGWGLPLQGSKETFQDGLPRQFHVDYNSHTILSSSPAATSPDYNLFMRGTKNPSPYNTMCTGWKYEAFTVSEANLVQMLSAADSSKQCEQLSGSFQSFEPKKSDEVHDNVVQGSKLFGKSTIGLIRYTANVPAAWDKSDCRSYHHNTRCSLYSKSNLQLSHTFSTDGKKLWVWVTDMTNPKAPGVSGASVQLYSSRDYDRSSTELFVSGTTTDDGTAELDLPSNWLNQQHYLHVVATKDSMYAVHSGYQSTPDHRAILISDMISDRDIYRVGETIHVKGYVRAWNEKHIQVDPNAISGKFTAVVRWQGMEKSEERIPLQVSKEYGSFHFSATVPAGVTYGRQYFYVDAGNHGGNSGFNFLVADPKIPTGELEATTTAKIFKVSENSVPIDISTKSYLGSLARNSEVTVNWNFVATNPETQLEKSGEETWTLPTGELSKEFRLPASVDLSAYDMETMTGSLRLTITWFTATRDKKEEVISLRVAQSTWESVSFSSDKTPVIPGFTFHMTQQITVPTPNKVPQNPAVKFYLYELPDSDSPTKHQASTLLSKSTRIGESDIKIEIDNTNKDTTNIMSVITYKLTKTGRYLFISAFTDEAGFTQYAVSKVGKSEREWVHDPISDMTQFSAPELSIVNENSAPKLKIEWDSPFTGYTWAARWGNDDKVATTVRTGTGKLSASLDIGDECALMTGAKRNSGCSMTFIASSGQQAGSATMQLPVPVPLSQFFQLGLPTTYSVANLAIPLKRFSAEEKLTIELSGEEEVTPDSQTDIKIKVTDQAGNPVQGEVALWVVNKAIYDLKPNPWPTPLAVERTTATTEQPFSSYGFGTIPVTTPEIIAKVQGNIKTRYEADAWAFQYPFDVNFAPQSNSQGLDIDSNIWLNCQQNWLTSIVSSDNVNCLDMIGHYQQPIWAYARDFGGGMAMDDAGMSMEGGAVMEKSVSMPMAHGGDESAGMQRSATAPVPTSTSSGGPAKDGGQVPTALLRSNFKTTPLFKAAVLTDSTGTATVPFDVPSNVGTWLVRAIVVNNNLNVGITERQIVSKRKVSLEASWPRITRVGDKFQAGVSVTSDLAGTYAIKVTLQDKQNPSTPQHLLPILIVGTNAKQVSVKKETPTEVVFEFESVGFGEVSAVMSAKEINTGVQDAFTHTTPSLGMQEPVFVATSFAITATDSKQADWSEGLDLPDAVPFTGVINMTIGVGRFPAVQQAVEGVVAQYKREIYNGRPPFASTCLDLMMAEYVLPKFKASEVENVQRLKREVSDIIDNVCIPLLKTNTDSNIGLIDWVGSTYPPTYVNFRLNVWALHMNRITGRLGADAIVIHWGNAVNQYWDRTKQEYLDCMKKKPLVGCSVHWLSELSFMYWSLGSSFTIQWRSQESNDLFTFQYLLDNRDKLIDNIEHQSYLMLALVDANPQKVTYSKIVSSIGDDIYKHHRVQGRTAYLAANTGSPYAASLQANGIALLAFQRDSSRDITDPLLEKLANYIANGGTTSSNRRWYSFSTRAAAYLMVALEYYDRAHGSTDPNLDVAIKGGSMSKEIVSTHFGSAGQPPFSAHYSWFEFQNTEKTASGANKPSAVQFSVTGKGEASIVLGMDFIPSKVFNNSVYFGFYVEKYVSVINDANGEELPWDPLAADLIPGQTVKVTIQVTTPDSISGGIQLIDPLPACFEAIDENIHPTAPSYSRQTSSPYPYWWWNTGFNEKQVKRDEVLCYAHHLYAGTFTCSYKATVVTSGSFWLPPTKVSAVQQPELMGLSNTHPVGVATRQV